MRIPLISSHAISGEREVRCYYLLCDCGDNVDCHLDSIAHIPGVSSVLCVVGVVHYKIWIFRVHHIVDSRRVDDSQCGDDIRSIELCELD
jgi:hypothetical protein